MTARSPAVDSPEGIRELVDWARQGGWVLSAYHEQIALKHGVSVEGVTITRQNPKPIFTPLRPR